MKETRWNVFFWFDRYELALHDITISGVNDLDDMRRWVQENKMSKNFVEVQGHLINFDNINYVHPQKLN